MLPSFNVFATSSCLNLEPHLLTFWSLICSSSGASSAHLLEPYLLTFWSLICSPSGALSAHLLELHFSSPSGAFSAHLLELHFSSHSGAFSAHLLELHFSSHSGAFSAHLLELFFSSPSGAFFLIPLTTVVFNFFYPPSLFAGEFFRFLDNSTLILDSFSPSGCLGGGAPSPQALGLSNNPLRDS